MPKNSKVPEPLRSLQAFVKAARKAEREDPQKRSAGEILFGSVTHKGVKKLTRMAVETNNIIDLVRDGSDFENDPNRGYWWKIAE